MVLRLAVPTERAFRVGELVDQRDHITGHQDQRHEDGLLRDRGLRLIAVGQREHRRDEQADQGEHEERGVRSGDLRAERLRSVADAAEQDAGAHHQEQVADDRSSQGRLDDFDQAGLERKEGDDQLGDVAKGRVQDAADLRAGQRAEPLGRQADHPGQPEDGRRRHEEQERRIGVQAEVEHDGRDADDGGDQECRPANRGELAEDGEAGARGGRDLSGHVAMVSVSGRDPSGVFKPQSAWPRGGLPHRLGRRTRPASRAGSRCPLRRHSPGARRPPASSP